MAAATIHLPLRVGRRTVARLRRRLVRVPMSLNEALDGKAPPLPPLDASTDGYLITGLPASSLDSVERMRPELKPFLRQRYSRWHVELRRSFDDYLGTFSGKSRSTLKRKLRRFAERSGGSIDVRCYRREDEVEQFYQGARAVSALSYQERLLNAGLPEGPEALARMRALAAQDQMRGWLLFLDGRPISYLYAPAEGLTLIYAHLGYDPDHSELSPGTVLQMEALRMLMEEQRFERFDFTEGEGQHKRQFATGSLECVDLLLLRRNASNLIAGHVLAGFDRAVAIAKRVVNRAGLDEAVRSRLQ
jgi:CelD/BcsL family acetyltransferase involved in cellulose biosynthesis